MQHVLSAPLAPVILGVSGIAIHYQLRRVRQQAKAKSAKDEARLPGARNTQPQGEVVTLAARESDLLSVSGLPQHGSIQQVQLQVSHIAELPVDQLGDSMQAAAATATLSADSKSPHADGSYKSFPLLTEGEEVAALLQQLDQERAAHAATRQTLYHLEGKCAEANAAHAELWDSYNNLLRDSDQQRRACEELEEAYAVLQHQLDEAKAAAAEAEARAGKAEAKAAAEEVKTAEAKAAMEVFKPAVSAGTDPAAATASTENGNRAPPLPHGLHKSASLRLQELQHERDTLAAQLATLTAKAGAQLSRSGSNRESCSSGSSWAAGSSGGASIQQAGARESSSGLQMPSSPSACSTGPCEMELSGSNHLADLLEGLQQLHVLTEDMVEAAEQVVSSSLAAPGDTIAGEGEEQVHSPRSPSHALHLLASRRSRLSTWGSGASAGDWAQLAGPRSNPGGSRLVQMHSSGGTAGSPKGNASRSKALHSEGWGSGMLRSELGAGALGPMPCRWGYGVTGDGRSEAGAMPPRPPGRSGAAGIPGRGGVMHWGSGVPSMEGVLGDGDEQAIAPPEGTVAGVGESVTASLDGLETAAATAAAGPELAVVAWQRPECLPSVNVTEGPAVAVAQGGDGATVGQLQQLQAALDRVTALEEQCSSLTQQNLDLQIFVAQQEEKLLVSSEIMRRMQALSQTLAAIRRPPSSTALVRPFDSHH